MISEIVVPVFYFLLLLMIIGSKQFFKSESISKEILMTAFSLKVFGGLIYGYLFKNGILSGDDSYLFFDNGNVVFSALDTDINAYLKLTFGRNDFTPIPSDLFPYIDNMHFWFDKSNYLLVRINAIIRIFSFNIYNVHALVFAFLSFVGLYNLYLFFENHTDKKKTVQFVLFAIPSVVFWTSGIHKEAISIFCLGIILYNLELILSSKKSLHILLFLFAGIFLLMFTRFYLFIIILPLIFALVFSKILKARMSGFSVFMITMFVFVFLLFVIDYYNPQISLIKEFFIRRNYFLESYPGSMTFDVVSKIPDNFNGYLTLFSEAFFNPVLRPYPSECNSLLTSITCIETYLTLILILFLMYKLDWKAFAYNSHAIFSVLFGFFTLILIGLIVNNSGAIVRYRSILIPFILIGLSLNKKKSV